MSAPHPFTFLTRDEWKLVFSVAYLSVADSFAGAYEIHRYTTRGEEGGTRDWCELFLRAVRFLALEHGATFKALRVHRSGVIENDEPVEPGNVNYAVLLKTGLPDLPSAFETAIRIAPPSLDLEPLKGALAQVRRDLAQALLNANHEEIQMIRDNRQEAFRALANERIH